MNLHNIFINIQALFWNYERISVVWAINFLV